MYLFEDIILSNFLNVLLEDGRTDLRLLTIIQKSYEYMLEVLKKSINHKNDFIKEDFSIHVYDENNILKEISTSGFVLKNSLKIKLCFLPQQIEGLKNVALFTSTEYPNYLFLCCLRDENKVPDQDTMLFLIKKKSDLAHEYIHIHQYRTKKLDNTKGSYNTNYYVDEQELEANIFSIFDLIRRDIKKRQMSINKNSLKVFYMNQVKELLDGKYTQTFMPLTTFFSNANIEDKQSILSRVSDFIDELIKKELQ